VSRTEADYDRPPPSARAVGEGRAYEGLTISGRIGRGRSAELHRLSTGDLATFWAEGPTDPMQIGLAGIFEGKSWLDDNGQLRISWLAEQVERRTYRAALLRRHIHWTGFGQGPPVWVDDPQLDIHQHVHVATDAPTDLEGFWTWAAERSLDPLDRQRPLWRLLFAPGIEGGRIGMVFVIHHVAVDGLAGVAALTSLLDESPEQPPPEPVWHAALQPTRTRLVLDNLITKAYALTRLLRALPHAPTLFRAASGTTHVVRQQAPTTSLSGAIGPARQAGVIAIPLDSAKQAELATGASINDLVLAAVTDALRQWLADRDELTPGLALRASMPIAVRGRHANAGRMVVVPLPVADPDPHHRLATLVDTTTALKTSGADVAHADITGSPLFPVSLMRVAIRWLARRGGLRVNCFVTNVPGPRVPLYLAGAELQAAVPFAPLVARVRLGITVFSYAGILSVTLLGDGDLPEWPDLVSAMRRSLQEVLDPTVSIPQP
jgi:diacylglycerol O-acyltransferase / wax synthase